MNSKQKKKNIIFVRHEIIFFLRFLLLNFNLLLHFCEWVNCAMFYVCKLIDKTKLMNVGGMCTVVCYHFEHANQ